MALLFDPDDTARAYYGTDARASALLLGAGLALVWIRAPRSLPRRWRLPLELGGLAGLGYLLTVVLLADTDAPFLYQGGLLLVALASALLILAAVQPTSPILGRVLALAPLTAIGLISYGLYLYHWPIFTWLSPTRVGVDGYELFALRLGVTLLVAVVSYFLVEQPIRRGAIPARRILVVAPAAVAAVLALTLVSTEGGRAATADDRLRYAYTRLAAAAPSSAHRVLVAGDALAFNLVRAQGGPRAAEDVVSTVAGIPGCGIANGRVMIGGYVAAPHGCAERDAAYERGVDSFDRHISVLMLSGTDAWDRELGTRTLRAKTGEARTYLRQRLERTRRLLTAGGARLVVMTVPCPIPSTGSPPALVALQEDATRVDWLNGILRSYAAEHRDDVTIADAQALLCPDGVPASLPDGTPLRTATGFTPDGARAFWE